MKRINLVVGAVVSALVALAAVAGAVYYKKSH